MADIDYRSQHLQEAKAERRQKRLTAEWTREWWFRLLALLFFTELIVPFVLWKAGLPASTDFLKEIAAAAVVGFVFAFMLLRDRIPGAILLILGITIIWGVLALLEGQAVSATAWGWWRLFKYPLIGIFAYLIPRWPPDFARWFFRFCVALLIFEIGVQLVQFAMGAPPGDSLAGTFPWKGVGAFTMFVFFVVCLGFGHWLAPHQARWMLLIIALGAVGSMLSVTKFYLMALALLGVAALVLHLVRGGRFRQLFLYIVLFGLSGAVFLPVYNNFIATTRGLKPLQEYLNMESIEGYLFNDGKGDEDGKYNLGRGLAITYAWQQISSDPITTLFGFGLGSRTSSTALNVAGRGLDDDIYGGVNTATLSTWIQEFGLVGMGLFMLMNIWLAWKMIRHARHTNDPYLATLEYGLSLFTLLWPLWLWYQKPWVSGVMMILYWVGIGFVFRQINQKPKRRPQVAGRERAAIVPADDFLS